MVLPPPPLMAAAEEAAAGESENSNGDDDGEGDAFVGENASAANECRRLDLADDALSGGSAGDETDTTPAGSVTVMAGCRGPGPGPDPGPGPAAAMFREWGTSRSGDSDCGARASPTPPSAPVSITSVRGRKRLDASAAAE
jgi:hypothetical protein